MGRLGFENTLCDYQPTLSVEFDQSQGFFVQGEVGGITAIDCGDGNNECSATVPAGTEVSLTAVALPGYVFDYWDTGTVCHYGNPLTVTVGEDMTYTAVFEPLRFPLDNCNLALDINLRFGDDWVFGECPVGVYKKHVGIDVVAFVGQDVFSAGSGIVKNIGYQSGWEWRVVIDHGGYASVYWHLSDPRGFISVDAVVSTGQKIGEIADLGFDTHFHFGIRLADYSFVSYAGALPVNDCGGYDAFPEFFIDPITINYSGE